MSIKHYYAFDNENQTVYRFHNQEIRHAHIWDKPRIKAVSSNHWAVSKAKRMQKKNAALAYPIKIQ